MANVTVAGPHGAISLLVEPGANLQLASQIAAAITAGVNGGALVPVSSLQGPPPPLPAGTKAEFVDQTHNSVILLPPGYDAVVNDTTNSTVFGSGGSKESVLSGAGGFTFIAPHGSGTVVAGGGNNTIRTLPQDKGDWSISTGPGNDKIVALGSGNDTIQPGGGHNTIVVGTGYDVLQLTGDDTVDPKVGHDTIDASGAKSSLIIGDAAHITFVGGAGSVTLLGGSGSDTFFGGSGTSIVRGGTGGHNLLFGGSGHASLFGAGNGDKLYAEGDHSQALYAGAGNETLSAAVSSGHVTLAGGSGKDQLVGGLGSDTFVGGTGHATMTAGLGGDTFTFINSHGGGRDLIRDFSGEDDKIDLRGYGPDAVKDALATQQVSGNSVTITLTDHTKITFSGVTTLKPGDFT